MKRKAKAGGEIGANGEFYKGGAFINTVAENPKGSSVARKPAKRQEIESYVWELPPFEGAMSIYRQLAGIEIREQRGSGPFRLNPDLRGSFSTAESLKRRTRLIALFNNGQRWI